jgi:hypothetical protein
LNFRHVRQLNPAPKDIRHIRQSTAGQDQRNAWAIFAQTTPLGRIGRFEKMADAPIFLAGDETSFSTDRSSRGRRRDASLIGQKIKPIADEHEKWKSDAVRTG